MYFLIFFLFQTRTSGHESIPATRKDPQGEESGGWGQKVQGVEGGPRTAVSRLENIEMFFLNSLKIFRIEIMLSQQPCFDI